MYARASNSGSATPDEQDTDRGVVAARGNAACAGRRQAGADPASAQGRDPPHHYARRQAARLSRHRRDLCADQREGRHDRFDLRRRLCRRRPNRQPAPGRLRVQRRARRSVGVPASGRAGAAHPADAGRRDGAEPALQDDRQPGSLARLHRPRLCRPGRHGVQPRRRQKGRQQGRREGRQPRQAVLECPCRPDLDRLGLAAMADPARPLAVAGLSRRRKLRRLSRGRVGPDARRGYRAHA